MASIPIHGDISLAELFAEAATINKKFRRRAYASIEFNGVDIPVLNEDAESAQAIYDMEMATLNSTNPPLMVDDMSKSPTWDR